MGRMCAGVCPRAFGVFKNVHEYAGREFLASWTRYVPDCDAKYYLSLSSMKFYGLHVCRSVPAFKNVQEFAGIRRTVGCVAMMVKGCEDSLGMVRI